MTVEQLRDLICKELARNMEAQDQPRIPAGGLLMWRWFGDLAASRTYHASGPNPIGYGEIRAYALLHRIPIRPDHVATLKAMDHTYLRAAAARQADRASGKKTLSPKSPGSLTSGLFDAMFG